MFTYRCIFYLGVCSKLNDYDNLLSISVNLTKVPELKTFFFYIGSLTSHTHILLFYVNLPFTYYSFKNLVVGIYDDIKLFIQFKCMVRASDGPFNILVTHHILQPVTSTMTHYAWKLSLKVGGEVGGVGGGGAHRLSLKIKRGWGQGRIQIV